MNSRDLYFKLQLTNLVESLNHNLRQTLSHSFTLMKQMTLLKSHQSSVLLRLINKRIIKSQQIYLKKWYRQAQALESAQIVQTIQREHRVRVVRHMIARKAQAEMRRGMRQWALNVAQQVAQMRVLRVKGCQKMVEFASRQSICKQALKRWMLVTQIQKGASIRQKQRTPLKFSKSKGGHTGSPQQTSSLKALVLVKSLVRVLTSVKLQSFRSLQTYSHHRALQ